MSLSLSIPGHTLVMEFFKPGPRVKAFKEENDSNNLTLGPSLGDSVTKVWPEIDIFVAAPFMSRQWRQMSLADMLHLAKIRMQPKFSMCRGLNNRLYGEQCHPLFSSHYWTTRKKWWCVTACGAPEKMYAGIEVQLKFFVLVLLHFEGFEVRLTKISHEKYQKNVHRW